MLQICGITAAYQRGYDILHEVTLEVSKGEIVCLIGPNGSGKSTVLKSIMGLVRVSSGSVLLTETDMTNIRPHRVLKAGIGYVPQGRKIFPGMTVWENLRMGGFVLRDKAELERRIARIYEMFPILDRYKDRKAYMLSGGEQQMISIGRSLLLDPAFMLVDEPSLGLSPRMIQMVFQRLREIGGTGIGILMVEQNAVEGLELASRGYVLDLGTVRFSGPSEQLLSDARIKTLYLGR